MKKKTRREVIVQAGAAMGALLGVAMEGAEGAEPIVLPPAPAPTPAPADTPKKALPIPKIQVRPEDVRTVKLVIKVPRNVKVVTEVQTIETLLSLDSLKGMKDVKGPPIIDMDLTSGKTTDWIKNKAGGIAHSCTCCVRG